MKPKYTRTEVITLMFIAHEWGLNNVPKKTAQDYIYEELETFDAVKRNK